MPNNSNLYEVITKMDAESEFMEDITLCNEGYLDDERRDGMVLYEMSVLVIMQNTVASTM